jgi:hypothetical protein
LTLSTGAGLEEGNPVLLLRQRLFDNQLAKGKLTKRYIAALFIKAWKEYMAGKRIKFLRFREEGDRPEMFPSLF